MDIINVIDRLESLITTSKTVPVSGNIIIDKDRVMELVDQLRLSIPQEIRAAEDVLARKDQIVNQAMLDARRTKIQADDEVRERMDKNEMVAKAESRAEMTLREAEERSERLLKQAEAEARTRRSEADAYALRSLRSLEQEINNIAGSVRKGIDYLAGQADGKMVPPQMSITGD